MTARLSLVNATAIADSSSFLSPPLRPLPRNSVQGPVVSDVSTVATGSQASRAVSDPCSISELASWILPDRLNGLVLDVMQFCGPVTGHGLPRSYAPGSCLPCRVQLFQGD